MAADTFLSIKDVGAINRVRAWVPSSAVSFDVYFQLPWMLASLHYQRWPMPWNMVLPFPTLVRPAASTSLTNTVADLSKAQGRRGLKRKNPFNGKKSKKRNGNSIVYHYYNDKFPNRKHFPLKNRSRVFWFESIWTIYESGSLEAESVQEFETVATIPQAAPI